MGIPPPAVALCSEGKQPSMTTDSWSTVSEYVAAGDMEHDESSSSGKERKAQHEGLGSSTCSPTSAADVNISSSSSSGIVHHKDRRRLLVQKKSAKTLIAETTMDASSPGDGLFKTPSSPNGRAPQLNRRSSFRRIASWLTGSSNNSFYTDDGSIADFQESEWTPQDSSYGAAIPIFGWIPKNVRRMIELTLIGLMIVAVVCLVVTTSIRATGGKNSSNTTNSGGLGLNDDYYVEVTNNVDETLTDDELANLDDQYRYDYYGDEEDVGSEDHDADDEDDEKNDNNNNYGNRRRHRLLLRKRGLLLF